MFKKSILKISIFMALSSLAFLAKAEDFSKPTPIVVSDAHKKAFQITANLLSNYHYGKLNYDLISNDVLKDYIKNLDYSGTYFLKSDVDKFLRSGFDLRRAISNSDLSIPIEIFNVYRKRASALAQWSIWRLKKPFNFTGKGVVHIPNYIERAKKQPNYFATEKQAQEYQEKKLTDSLIELMISGRTEQEAIRKLTRRYEALQKRINQFDSDDVFGIFMNSLTMRFDPHSTYSTPMNKEDFDINMSLSLQGIGATLSNKDEKITIAELLPGGPAYKSGKLKVNDQIIGIGQGKDGEIKDVIGMRLDKTVQLIRGKKGTFVRLLIEPANQAGVETEVVLERDIINLEDQAAQGYVEKIKHEGKDYNIGVIKLPSFYMDFDGARKGKKDFRSTSGDIKKILKDMNAKKVQGIIVDLRGNSGGSLAEVVKAVGLFIDEGPVVTVSNAKNVEDEQWDKIKGSDYTGPLIVMIDEGSASASEIFAAAIQDYQRGIIVGSNTYGKGTVQNVMGLNRFASRNSAPLGDSAITIAMFFRVNGSSTQLVGVSPDISLPSQFDLKDVGERSKNYALSWKKISPAIYIPYNNVSIGLIDRLNKAHQSRMQNFAPFLRYGEYMQRVKVKNEKSDYSLNLELRKKEHEEWKNFVRDYKNAQLKSIPMLKSDEKSKERIEKMNALAETEDEKEIFSPDVGLYETLFIMADNIRFLK